VADLNIPAAPAIPGTTHVHSGKVRDLYRIDEGEHAGRLLMVASDRISAYDFVLDSTIPDKGEILTRMSLWWFDQLAELVDNHVVSTDVPESVRGRAVICESLEMFPVECVARGYLTGSGLLDYRATGEVCGIALPDGLVDGSLLPEPIFTPATKAAVGDHDENVSYDAVVAEVGAEAAAHLRDLTLQVYGRAHDLARERGIILADTKFEFGRRVSRLAALAPQPTSGSLAPQPTSGSLAPQPTSGSLAPQPAEGEIVLADEVLTPDSSRFWPADGWEPGRAQASYDKQIVRNWLTSPESGWDKASGEAPPTLPTEIVERTRARYVEAYELLTGERF
jgi:phosphoribosylaminoimidazole-succinocarboxamide synthase